jgi:hypothetical protein
MAKPRELYSGPAPQAMSLMGAGIADAYARAGEIEGRGMQAMGQGIAQGITSAASSIAGYLKETKQIESQNKSFENLLKNPAGRQLLGMDEASANQFLADAKNLNARDQNQMFNFALPNMMQQNFVMQKMGKDFGYDVQKLGISNENAMNLLGLQALLGNKTYQPTSGAAVAPNYSVMPASTQPASTSTETFRPKKFTISTGSTSWTP